MCGIAGIIYRDNRHASATDLTAMEQALIHRGPDGAGIASLPHGGLAHRRLAIVDLTDAARQPFSSEDERVHLVFNGEIYNFRQLRFELEARGEQFRSEGDTEVILRLYLAFGEQAIDRLDGMFSLAIWDQQRGTVLLARDRTGKKPLYVYRDATKMLFGSEIKAILSAPGVKDEANPDALPLYLTYGYVPTPGTFYSHIESLPPATCRTISLSTFEHRDRAYWDFPQSETPERPPLIDAERRIRDLFISAVQRRLVSDVPLGAFLSGGVDSSLVVGVMAGLLREPVKTFSLGFEGPAEFDETPYARLVAQRFGAQHTEFRVKPEAWELLSKLAWHYDQPFGDSSAIPTYIVSKLSRAHVTVCLTGDGGDELFAGYPRFFAAQVAEWVPETVRSALAHSIGFRHLGPGTRRVSDRLERFAAGALLPLDARLALWSAYFAPDELANLVSGDRATAVDRLFAPMHEVVSRSRGPDLINRLLYVNARTFLLDDLNVKMDRASMAASVETRSPFLDTSLIEYVFNLVGDLKLRRGQMKWILKRAFHDLLPEQTRTRKKMGFSIPLGDWFRGQLGEFVRDQLLSPNAALYPSLNRDAVVRLYDEHVAGRRDNGQRLWLLSMLERWLASRRQSDRSEPRHVAASSLG